MISRMFCLTALLLSGCSEPTPLSKPEATFSKQVSAITSQTPVKQELTKSLPTEYITLAEILGMPAITNSEQGVPAINVQEVYHKNIMTLQRLKTDDPDIAYISNLARTSYEESLQILDRLRALPRPQDEGSAMVESFLYGALGDIQHGLDLGTQNQQAKQVIARELEKCVIADDRIDVAHQLLEKVAVLYAPPVVKAPDNQRILIDFDESWGSNGYDWCKLQNRGPAINNCTIVVEITGAKGDVRKNLHFIKSWPRYGNLFCPYTPGVLINERVVGIRSTFHVQKVRVTLYSPELSLQQYYAYSQEEKDKDVKGYCENLKFTCSYRPYDPGILFADERGVYVQMAGLQRLPKCRVTLVFKQGSRSVSWYWDHDAWTHAEAKTFETPKGGLSYDPDLVDMSIAFFDSNYVHNETFKLKP